MSTFNENECVSMNISINTHSSMFNIYIYMCVYMYINMHIKFSFPSHSEFRLSKNLFCG